MEQKTEKMENTNLDKETSYLLVLISFGLIVTLVTELLQVYLRPVILLVFIGISTTALIYKLLGGFSGSMFETPLFRLTGSAAFLFAFIAFINPILVKQTYPTKEDMFDPPLSTWVPVSNINRTPIDTLKLNFLDLTYESTQFGKYDSNSPLYFEVSSGEIGIFNDSEYKVKLGNIKMNEIKPKLTIENTITYNNSEIFMDGIKINELTNDNTWFKYKIRPIKFNNEITTYEICDATSNNKVIDKGEIKSRGSKIHIFNNETFLITIHSVNHKKNSPWAKFAVTKLEISTN